MLVALSIEKSDRGDNMATIGVSLWQLIGFPRSININSRSTSVSAEGKIRLKPQASPAEPDANKGEPKRCGVVRSCFSKELAGAQGRIEKQAADEAGTVSNDLNKGGEALDLSEIQATSFENFQKCWASKNGDSSYKALYDYDNNGVIDMVDWLGFGKEMQASFQEFKAAYGTTTGAESYNSTYDSDGNGKIDMEDWLAFGKKWTA